MRPPTRRRRATAYHEAAHAVADHVFGFTAAEATIVKQGHTLGAAEALDHWCSPGSTGRENERRARRGILCLLAGHAAEVEFCGKDDHEIGGAWGDFERAEEVLRFMVKRSLDDFKDQARIFVRRHSAKITRVAEELLRCGSLDDTELYILIADRGRGLDVYRAFRAEARSETHQIEKAGHGGSRHRRGTARAIVRPHRGSTW